VGFGPSLSSKIVRKTGAVAYTGMTTPAEEREQTAIGELAR
jgi:hypothetical protein